MKKSYWIIMILNYLSTGVMIPVLSLVFIEKGCTLANLSLILGLYSLSVIILELPSGILADLIGRKRVYLISCFFSLAAAAVLLFIKSIMLLIPVVILMGAGRAFASGSVDSVIIESYIEKYGADKIAAVSSKLSLCEIAGLSSGSILGGFLPVIAPAFLLHGTYDLNIILALVFCGAVTVLCAVILKEKRSGEKENTGLKKYMNESFKFLKSNRIFLLISLGMLCAGFFLFTVETYWQPAYTALLPVKSLGWTLGFIPFGFFLFAGLGNIAIKHFLTSKPRLLYTGYSAACILIFIALFVFSLQRSLIGFCASLFAVYFFFGGANVAGSAILNTQIPDSRRAGMLSFGSLVFQTGGIIAPAVSGIASNQEGIRILWGFVAIVLLIVSVVIGFALKRNSAKFKTVNEPSNIDVYEKDFDPACRNNE